MNSGDDSYFILEVSDEDGVPTISAYTPPQVLVVKDEGDLAKKLEHYSDPFNGHVLPNTRDDRRWYVEKIRPTLRFYCKKFEVDAPEWLSNDGEWVDRSDEELEALFGTSELKLREFQRLNSPDIAVVREEPVV